GRSRTSRVRDRGLCLVSCHARRRRSASARRRYGARFAVRHVSPAEHLARPGLWYRTVADDRSGQCADERRVALGAALLSGPPLRRLRAYASRGCARPDGLSAYAAAGEGQAAASRIAFPNDGSPARRVLEANLSRPVAAP